MYMYIINRYIGIYFFGLFLVKIWLIIVLFFRGVEHLHYCLHWFIIVLFFRGVECLHYWLHWFIIVLFSGESDVYTIGYIGLIIVLFSGESNVYTIGYIGLIIVLFLGESNVYTIGYIGEHKVVSTKLPAIGHFRAAQIAAGNTTTRLLGEFNILFVVTLVEEIPT